MVFQNKYVFAAAVLLLVAACSKKEDAPYVQTTFIMSTPAHVRIFGAGDAEGKIIADAVFKEWKRISGEYSITEPYGYIAYVNKNAYREWVRVDDEFLGLLNQAMDYFNLTGGAFDITFAPLWPIWREAAASKKMPAKEEITKALADMGSGYVQMDRARKTLHFTRPVEINMGGILRSYALQRGRAVIQRVAGDRYPVELKIGGNVLAYGKRDWSYDVPDPFHEGSFLGRLHFGEGLILSSSGREHFVQIEGRLYSHILDLKTGYPLPDFSNLIVYFPNTEKDEYIPSAVLAVMGKEKAFALLGRVQGAAALWIDGSGKTELFLNKNSAVRWEKTKRSLF
jgi:FAD:protein FMN transferase